MNDKIIGLLKKDEFVSGELLAEKLGISRTAIWKQIKSLKDIGYEIESVKNKGYRLVLKPDIPLPEEIKNGLDTKIIGKKIIYFKTIDSTNSYCKNLVREGIVEGTVVVADIQKKGRGRKN
ncbi:MAG: HTH domain-containing protein, partial [Candidatus Cloacimonadota bacterium]|nr:HTH domain-containing protein [Candidatus Cloacimonadota bacterium]